jgi:ferrous iron transport protein B
MELMSLKMPSLKRRKDNKENNMSVQHPDAYTKRDFSLVDYGIEIENEIGRLQKIIENYEDLSQAFTSRWLAIKLLEEDSDLSIKVGQMDGGPELLEEAQKSIAHLRDVYGDDVDTIIADRRYGWINGLVKEVVQRSQTDQRTLSDKIDKVLTSRILGIPIFLAVMWVVFKITTDLSVPMMDWIDGVISGPISNWVVALLNWMGLGSTWVESLFIEGIIAGVGGVLVFVPVMAFLYIALAILEDSGYMARAAFVMDRLMHGLGLHGKSFLPMIIGFGCSVPALMATRTLDNEKDRILTGLLVPFMSCGARLPVYVLLASVFFSENSGIVIFWMYILGIVIAILVGLLLKNTLFKGKEQSPFVMELPPYRLPTLKGIGIHMWERSSAFLKKAWSIILITSVIIWLLLAIPLGGGAFAETPVENSAFASFSQVIAPAFKPLGFGDWKMSGPLITGFVAKEVVISTMIQVYDLEEVAEEELEQNSFLEDIGDILVNFINAIWDTIRSIPLIIGVDVFEAEEEPEPTALMNAVEKEFEEISNGHGALASVAYMSFVLLYTPCMVAVAAERKELGAKWMWLSIFGQTAIAWLVAFLIFQGGLLLGIG